MVSGLADYRKHYRADAEFIEDPRALPPVRFASERRRLEAAIRRIGIGQGISLLDVGCGSGWLAHQCVRLGAAVTATDIAPSGVAAARARFREGATFVVADVYDMPLAAASFDVVILSEVLEHLESVDRALAQVRRLLAPGGRLVITVPFRETILHHLCVHCNRPTPANAHLHSFDARDLKNYLAGQDMAVADVGFYNNKLLELIGFPRMSRWWPHWAWRAVDRLFNSVTGRPAFAMVVASARD